MAGLQSSPTTVLLRQVSAKGTTVSFRGADEELPIDSPKPVRLALMRAGLGLFSTYNAGKFCHASLVWLAGHEEIYGASRVQAHD